MQINLPKKNNETVLVNQYLQIKKNYQGKLNNNGL